MKRKNIAIAVLAVALVLGMNVGRAFAYFTDTTHVAGSLNLVVKPSSEITEETTARTKTVRIRNTGSVVPVWVRARAYAPSTMTITGDGGANWTPNGEWFDYSEPLPAGATTDPLTFTLAFPEPYDQEKNPNGARGGDELNVIVEYECQPVQYGENGDPLPANWN